MDIRPEMLSLQQVAAYLQVTTKTIYRMIKAGKLPARRVGGQWRFRRVDLDSWFDAELPRLSSRTVASVSHAVFPGEVHLWECIPASAVRIGLKSRTRDAAIAEMVGLLKLDKAVREPFLRLVLQRESMLSTGIGDGVAIPHPRHPALDEQGLNIAVGISRAGIPWDSCDAKPVHCVFLVAAATETLQLLALARLNRLLRTPGFIADLKKARSAGRIIALFRSRAGRG